MNSEKPTFANRKVGFFQIVARQIPFKIPEKSHKIKTSIMKNK